MRTHLTVLLTVLGFVGLIAPAAAHHGFETQSTMTRSSPRPVSCRRSNGPIRTCTCTSM